MERFPRSMMMGAPFLPSATSSPSTISGSSMSTTVLRKRRPKHNHYRLSMAPLLALTIILFFATPALSVLINTFENCLADNVQSSPTHIQFHPLLVAATFSVNAPEKVLEVTVWGNVTGENTSTPGKISRRNLYVEGEAYFRPRAEEGWAWWEKRQTGNTGFTTNVSSAQLPRGNWGQIKVYNPTIDGGVDYLTTGEIVDVDRGWGQNIATTLRTSIMVASFRALNSPSFFCGSGHPDQPTANADCPMGVVKLSNMTDPNDLELLMKELHSFTFKTTMASAYHFATLDTTFQVLSGDKANTTIGCIHVEITPLLGSPNEAAVTWVPAGVLALVALGTVLAAMLNPWVGTVDIFRWSSNFGMDEDMIRLVTPGFADCLQWLQFFVLSGSLSLSYPGFYQPTVSKLAWSTLLFNTSFYTFESQSTADQSYQGDGIYALDSTAYGLERLAQALGLRSINDIWVCMAAFFAIVVVVTVLAVQLWFAFRWIVRTIRGHEEEDLTQKNLPFTVGLLNRITFTYFLAPILAVSSFQVTVAGTSSTSVVVCAGITILVALLIIIYLTIRIWNHRPRSTLFDNLPTLLTFGTFYNTYREKGLRFFIIQLYVNVIRALAFGALQPSGIAQITILAVCEIVLILTVYGIKPYASATSMNAWQATFAMIRLLTILLMMAFVPSMNTDSAVKGWIGYVILAIHALVLIFGFFFMAVQTMLELFIRGYGGDDGEAARGGLAKVFGMRQLSRRKHKTHPGSVDPSIMTINEDRKMSKMMGNGRTGNGPMSRTDSSAVLLGGAISSVGGGRGIDGVNYGHAHSGSGSTGFTPTTPGAASQISYLPGAGPLNLDTSAAAPFYRPPRAKGLQRTNGEGSASDNYSPGERSRGSWGSDIWATGGAAGKNRNSQHSSHGSRGGNIEDGGFASGGPSGVATPLDAAGIKGGTIEGLAHRHTDSSLGGAGSVRAAPDYAVREGDFYYGVRGPALSSQPARRLGTGPADPTGSVAVAKGWLMRKLGFAGKEDKGFTVVRSSRAPEELLEAEREAKGIGMAISADAPIRAEDDSDSDSGDEQTADSNMLGKRRAAGPAPDTESEGESEDENVTTSAPGPSARMLEKQPEYDGTSPSGIELVRQGSLKPQVPRKSSKRKSSGLLPALVMPSEMQHQQHHTVDEDPDSPIHVRKPDQLYDPHYSPPRTSGNSYLLSQAHPLRHKPNLSVQSTETTTRLPFTSSSSREDQTGSSGYSRSISTSSSILSPPQMTVEDEPGSRPASVGTVQRFRMEDSLRIVGGDGDLLGSRAELVEHSRSASMGSQFSRNGSQKSRPGV